MALLTCLLMVGCSNTTRSVLPATDQTRYCVYVPSSDFADAEEGGAWAAVPAPGAGSPTAPLRPSPPPLRGLPGGGGGDGIPRGMLRPMPQSGAAAAGAGTGAAAGEALVTGGAVIAAAGSVLLLCITVNAIVDGGKTPIDIADRFYGTHLGDISGWVQGRYTSNDTAYAHAIEVEIIIGRVLDGEATVAIHALNKEPASASHPRPRASLDSETIKDNKRGRIYATYTKFNKRTSLYYSGRASMVTDLNPNIPLEFLARLAIQLRDANHHLMKMMNPKTLRSCLQSWMSSISDPPLTMKKDIMMLRTGEYVEESSN
jgi:hypothetical protein